MVSRGERAPAGQKDFPRAAVEFSRFGTSVGLYWFMFVASSKNDARFQRKKIACVSEVSKFWFLKGKSRKKTYFIKGFWTM